ncbi:hypothetical protein DLAC_02413 [Tieghemostelium lacteum]|uniref:Uncharacterized protein n=1 Tax=Tieghemostelium lacteum TaxID=361077 RepID=A0A152A4X0_TIELA|nr:hypothetical protein DLAC_02413 [Tieghemostelium lacteum]|eukprot:KYR01289.1 hypothetical protein DLAC_02413 [Tieghemostelium lacteum]
MKIEIIVLGDDSKSALIRKLMRNKNPKIEDYLSSTFYNIDVKIWNQSEIKVRINDHNDERWKKGQVYKNAILAFIVFDPSKGVKGSLQDIQYLVQEINRFSNTLKIKLISNPAEHNVDFSEIKEYASNNGFEIFESTYNYPNNKLNLSSSMIQEDENITFKSTFFAILESLLPDEVFDYHSNTNLPSSSSSSLSSSSSITTKKTKSSLNLHQPNPLTQSISSGSLKIVHGIMEMIPNSSNINQEKYEDNFYKVFRNHKLSNLIFQYVPVIYKELGIRSVKYHQTTFSGIVNNNHPTLLKERLLYDTKYFAFSYKTLLDFFKANKSLEITKILIDKYLVYLKRDESIITVNCCQQAGNLEIVRFLYGRDLKFTINSLYNAIICSDLDVIKFLMKHCKLFSQNQSQEMHEMHKAIELAKEHKNSAVKSYITKHCSSKTKSISLFLNSIKKKISGSKSDPKSIDLNRSDDDI